ncbi:MAG: hypothetical protein AAF618_08580 [Pseudomonadota bacterium]
MSSGFFIFLVSAAIIVILLVRAITVVRNERGVQPRGAEPGEGDHIIHSEYSSGLSGHATTYKIPRDPQAYAKRFVPRGTQK